MDSYIFGAPKDKDAHSSKDRTKMSSARNEVIHISLDDVEFDAFDVYNNNEGDTNTARQKNIKAGVVGYDGKSYAIKTLMVFAGYRMGKRVWFWCDGRDSWN